MHFQGETAHFFLEKRGVEKRKYKFSSRQLEGFVEDYYDYVYQKL